MATEGPARAGRGRLVAVTLGVVAIVLAGTALIVVLRDRGTTTAPPAATPGTSAHASTTPSATPSATVTGSPSNPLAVTLPSPYQPLWPFRDLAEVTAWQASYTSGGHQPWHTDPAETALSFAQGYLDYPDIDRVVAQSVNGPDAHVSVGYLDPNGAAVTAAVVHVLVFGTASPPAWEVVGTDDTTLTLDEPAYGVVVGTPLTVGGLITGVDESLHVQVHQIGTASLVGDTCCVAAGGQAQAWSARVAYAGATDHVLTVSVSTGGHVQGVERFAVTAVLRPGA